MLLEKKRLSKRKRQIYPPFVVMEPRGFPLGKGLGRGPGGREASGSAPRRASGGRPALISRRLYGFLIVKFVFDALQQNFSIQEIKFHIEKNNRNSLNLKDKFSVFYKS